MTLRRRRMLATLLALALCLSLLPMSALAAEADALGETGPEEAVCTCTAPCTEGGMNTACPVCGAEGAAPEDCGQSLPQGSGEAKIQPLANEGISLLSTQEKVSYIDPTKEQTEQTCDSATEVTESDTTWGDDNNDGWYVVNSNVTISTRVTVTGDVHLILKDGFTLNATKGINVTGTNSLTIYAQSENENTMGKLDATAPNDEGANAAIGGSQNETAGTITINGGKITAKNEASPDPWLPNIHGAAIGGGGSGGSGTITINGGIVNATTARNGDGAGIGSGENAASGSITITGGVVYAASNGAGAGIGGGYCGSDYKGNQNISITISGGTVTAFAGYQSAAIGAGRNDNKSNVYQGTFSTGENGNAVIFTGCRSSEENDLKNVLASISKFDSNSASGVIFIFKESDASTTGSHAGKVYGSVTPTEDFTIPAGYTLTIDNGTTLTIPEGVTLTNNGTINVDVGTLTNNGTTVNNGTISGDVGGTGNTLVNTHYLDTNNVTQDIQANLVTTGSTTWTGSDPDGGWYVVQGKVDIGSLVTVTGNVNLILADGCNLTVNGGINVSEGNSLTIYGQSGGTGKLIATGHNSNQAGIGGKLDSAGGTITINGGTVNATGAGGGAGIGGSWGCAFESITINSGTVTATGGIGGAGIGSGRVGGAGGTITINGGHVTANGSQGTQRYYCAGIGGGFQGAGGSITINGGVVNAHGGWTGIGSGEDGLGGTATGDCAVTVNGGVVTATGEHDAGIGGTFSTGEDGHAVIIADGKDDNEISDDGNTTGWSGLIITKTQGEGKIYGSDSFEIVNDLEIPEGYTLTIENGETLTIPTGVTLNNNGTIICNGTINGTVGGDVRYPSAVTVSVNQGDQSVTSVAYGSNITITATMTKQIATNALTAAVGTVDFWLGEVDTGTKLGPANVTGSGSTYTATLEVTLNDATKWIPSNSPYTITADFGGVAGTSGDGLISSAGSATLTVTKGNQTAPDAPTMSSRTTTSVTLNAVANSGEGGVQYGYTMGNEDSVPANRWQTGTTFTNLTSGTTYTFYARYAENDYYEPSPVSTGTSIVTLGAEGGDTLADGETITTEDGTGTKITKDEGKITITPGGGGSVTVITPADNVTVNTDEGTVNVPDGSTVTTGDGPSITVGEGGATVGTDGGVTLPDGGSATIGSGDDATTITTPGGGTIDPDTGAVTPDEGGSVVIGSGEDTTTVTPPNGQPVTPNDDGTITVPDGSTVQTGDGPEMTLPGGGTVDPDTGAITPDEGGSVVIDTGDGTTTITPPSGQPVTPNDDGSVTIPGGSTVTGSDGERVTIPPEGGTLQPGGDVEYTVTVTFDSQGGSQVPSQDITVGEPVSQPDDPTRTGYRFLGWYTAATGGAHWDFTQPVTGDQTLYAQWAYLPPANPNYKITIGDTENGTVTVNPTAAKEGTTVTITPVPDAGYQVGTVSVTDRFGQAVAVDQQADGTYTFVMPDGQVTVEVTFLQGEAPDLPFSDVTESDWFYDAVTYAYENGLMDGVGAGLFAPNSETTRAQLVTILYRLSGQPAPSGDSGFSDVETGTWYTDAVAWAAQNGIVNGVSDTQFVPGDDITREQLAVILYRYATYQGYDVSQRADLSGFVDAGTISTYAQEALSWANAQGLVLGFEDDSLRPQGTATRAQIAAVLMRFCQTVAE